MNRQNYTTTEPSTILPRITRNESPKCRLSDLQEYRRRLAARCAAEDSTELLEELQRFHFWHSSHISNCSECLSVAQLRRNGVQGGR